MSEREERDLFGPQHLSQALPKVRPPSRIKQRLIDSAVQIEAEGPDSILYQHTVFCQTGLPYRDPGEIRLWKRSQGALHLEVEAGRAFHPRKADFVDVGLPFFPSARSLG